MNLTFSRFAAADFDEYTSRYDDTALNMHLGPMGKAWLESVLSQTNGIDYSIFLEGELVAVIGFMYPDAAHPFYFITDFAIKPHLRSRGIGSAVLRELLHLHPLKPSHYWRTVVDVNNPQAKSFFEKNGWACLTQASDEHGMLTLEWRNNVVGREGLEPPKA